MYIVLRLLKPYNNSLYPEAHCTFLVNLVYKTALRVTKIFKMSSIQFLTGTQRRETSRVYLQLE